MAIYRNDDVELEFGKQTEKGWSQYYFEVDSMFWFEPGYYVHGLEDGWGEPRK